MDTLISPAATTDPGRVFPIPAQPRGPLAKLAFLVDELEARGGSELHLLTLLQGLRGAGWAAELVVLGRSALAPLYEQAGIPVHRWPLRRAVSPGLPLHAARLARWLRDHDFGLVETLHTAADLIGPLAGALAGVPVVSSRRDLGIFRSGRHRLIARLTNGLVTGFVAPSAAVRDAAGRAEGVAPERFVLIPNGVDATRFRPGLERGLRDELGLPATTPLIGAVASLTPVKRPLVLLEAFVRLVRGPHPEAHLLLAGGGPLAARVELQVQSEGLQRQVHLLGPCAAPEQVYAALDVHVLASGSEGFSNTLLEAMACGLPVIATRVGGNVEVVEDEVNGCLVPPDDGPALAAALARLLADPQRAATWGQRARARVLERFTVEAMVTAHATFFRALLAARQQGPRIAGWPLPCRATSEPPR